VPLAPLGPSGLSWRRGADLFIGGEYCCQTFEKPRMSGSLLFPNPRLSTAGGGKNHEWTRINTNENFKEQNPGDPTQVYSTRGVLNHRTGLVLFVSIRVHSWVPFC